MEISIHNIRNVFISDKSFQQLDSHLREWKDIGCSQVDIYNSMSEYREELLLSYDENSRIIQDLESCMDYVWGFCSIEKCIWDTSLQSGTDGKVKIYK